MKQSNNNAVDLLLRSLARRDGERTPRVEEGNSNDHRAERSIASEHLDADELNLFAEGVLPNPARLRYAAHLADCNRCRGMMVGLAQTAGTTARQEAPAQTGGAGFWQGFWMLFSLPVIRYALPVLVLTSVIGIVLLAMREKSTTGLVAMNEQPAPTQPVDASSQLDQSQANTPIAAPTTTNGARGVDAGATADVNQTQKENKPEENKGLLAKSTDDHVEPGSTVGGVVPAPEQQVAGAKAAQPGFASEPPPPAPKNEPVTIADKKAMVRKDEDEALASRRGQDDVFKIQPKEDSPRHGPARSRSELPRDAGGSSLSVENRAEREKDKRGTAEEVETRTVSGRRFRREGNAWIDTAYKSSGAVTNVGRGSEQFRALIADEPGLRSIFQQLGGEVIVVWKNRAYRIR